MSIRGLSKLRQVGRWVQNRFTPKALILMYHRVAQEDLDPWSLCVTPQNFAQHLEVLQTHTQPMSLKQLAQAHQDGNIPDQAVAITFDDGYANNLYNAKPILNRYNIPATVFVTSGYTQRHREFWWDELEQVLLQPGKLADKLCLTIEGNTHEWELGTAVEYSKDEQRDRHHQGQASPGTRLSFYYSVWQQLQPLPEAQRQQLLDEIITWAETEPVPRPTHRPLTLAEIPILEQDGLVEVGAHTVNHPLLSAQSIELQRQEIIQSKADLEKILAHPVSSFAYPFGAYTPQTVPLVHEAGFTYACSTVEHTVRQYSDCLQLPRFEVLNWNGKEFEQRLLQWFQR